MNNKIITVGNLKEKYLVEAQKEYGKRLSGYGKIEIIEIKEEKLGQNPSEKEIEQALEKESRKILEKIDKDFCIVLAVEGKQFASEDLAKFVKEKEVDGYGGFSFIIGSSHGLHPDVKERGDLNLSFSKMTLPHQLMRIVLLEQIYRVCKINNNENYHK